MNRQGQNNNEGFSLVELMMVVGIMGLLAAISVPKLQLFTAKAKQAEAKAMLKTAHSLETSYFAENAEYTSTPAVLGLSPIASGLWLGNNYAVQLYLTGGVYTYTAAARLQSGKSLCPGVSGDYDFWGIGDCPDSVSACMSVLTSVRSGVLGSNSDFKFDGAPRPYKPNLVNSCN